MQLNFNNNPFEKARDAFKSSSPNAKTFDEHKANFEKSRLGRQVEKAFTPLPYELENKGLYRMAGVLSYACQFVSVTAAASFVFAFIFSRINTISGAWYIAFFLAGAILFCIEYLLRRETAPVSRQILLGYFSSKLWRRVAFVFVLTSIGVISSYYGGFDTAAAIATDKPVFSAPTALSSPVIDLSEIRERYESQISDAKTAAAAYKKDRLWKNRLSIADANKHRKLLAVATEKENDLNNEIKAATATNTEQRNKTIQENNNRSVIAKRDYEELIISYDNRVNGSGSGLAYLSVLCQLIFFCCCFYRSYYLIETAKQYSSPNSGEDDTDPSGGGGYKRINKSAYNAREYEGIIDNQMDANEGLYNRVNMRVLRGGKSAQTEFVIDATDKTQAERKTTKTIFVPTDLTVKHTDRQTGEIRYLNITQVRANIGANKSRLKKARVSGTDRQIKNIKSILVYWKDREYELIQAAAVNKSELVG